MLPEHQSKAYTSQSKRFSPSPATDQCYGTCVGALSKTGNMVKQGWIKSVQMLHGREFLAELLATFVLIVS